MMDFWAGIFSCFTGYFLAIGFHKIFDRLEKWQSESFGRVFLLIMPYAILFSLAVGPLIAGVVNCLMTFE